MNDAKNSHDEYFGFCQIKTFATRQLSKRLFNTRRDLNCNISCLFDLAVIKQTELRKNELETTINKQKIKSKQLKHDLFFCCCAVRLLLRSLERF